MKKNIKIPSGDAPPLPFEEWDFRMVDDDLETLQTVTEYEYLRSSHLKGTIEEWHRTRVSQTKLRAYYLMAAASSEQGLFPFKRSRTSDHLLAVNRSTTVRKEHEAEHKRLFDILMKTDCTVGQFIGNLFRRCQMPRTILFFLSLLRKTMPEKIWSSHADWVALRFDLFPTAWMLLPAGYAHARSWEQLRKGYGESLHGAVWEVHPLNREAPLIFGLFKKICG